MKKLVIVTLLLMFVAASIAVASGSDVMTFENKKGAITFDHKAHQEKVGGDCAKCHEGTPGKFEVTKDFGHKTCKGCHKEMNGPTKCDGCHK